MSTRSRRYKGFTVTPHSQLLEGQVGARLWTVGVFLRTHAQTADQNRYFQLRGVLVSSKDEALKQGLSYGKRLIDEDLVPYIRRYSGKRHSGLAAKAYRRARDSLMWHFSERCSFWPRQDYVQRRTTPALKELCNECLALASTSRT